MTVKNKNKWSTLPKCIIEKKTKKIKELLYLFVYLLKNYKNVKVKHQQEKTNDNRSLDMEDGFFFKFFYHNLSSVNIVRFKKSTNKWHNNKQNSVVRSIEKQLDIT